MSQQNPYVLSLYVRNQARFVDFLFIYIYYSYKIIGKDVFSYAFLLVIFAEMLRVVLLWHISWL